MMVIIENDDGRDNYDVDVDDSDGGNDEIF